MKKYKVVIFAGEEAVQQVVLEADRVHFNEVSITLYRGDAVVGYFIRFIGLCEVTE